MDLKTKEEFLNESLDKLFSNDYDFSKVNGFEDKSEYENKEYSIVLNEKELKLQTPLRDLSIKLSYDTYSYNKIKNSDGKRMINLKIDELNKEANLILYKAQEEIAKLMLDLTEDLEENKDSYFTKE